MKIIKFFLMLLGTLFLIIIAVSFYFSRKFDRLRQQITAVEEQLEVKVIKVYMVDGTWYCLVMDEFGNVSEITLFDQSNRLDAYDNFVDKLF